MLEGRWINIGPHWYSKKPLQLRFYMCKDKNYKDCTVSLIALRLPWHYSYWPKLDLKSVSHTDDWPGFFWYGLTAVTAMSRNEGHGNVNTYMHHCLTLVAKWRSLGRPKHLLFIGQSVLMSTYGAFAKLESGGRIQICSSIKNRPKPHGDKLRLNDFVYTGSTVGVFTYK